MNRNNTGFTMIEILVVVAVIGILASITLVFLSSARKRAAVVTFKSEVSSLASSAMTECSGKTSAYYYSYGAGTYISAGIINCADGGFIEETIITPSKSAGNCVSGTVTESGTTFQGC